MSSHELVRWLTWSPSTLRRNRPQMPDDKLQQAHDLANKSRSFFAKILKLSEEFEAKLEAMKTRLTEASSTDLNRTTSDMLPCFLYLIELVVSLRAFEHDEHVLQALRDFVQENPDLHGVVPLMIDVLDLPNLHRWNITGFALFAEALHALEADDDIEQCLGVMEHQIGRMTWLYERMSDLIPFASGSFDESARDHEDFMQRLASWAEEWWGEEDLDDDEVTDEDEGLSDEDTLSTEDDDEARAPWIAELTAAKYQERENDVRCTICLNNEMDEALYHLSCSCMATYHKECLSEWFSTKDAKGKTPLAKCLHCQLPIKTIIVSPDDYKDCDSLGVDAVTNGAANPPVEGTHVAGAQTGASSANQVQWTGLADVETDHVRSGLEDLSLG